MPNKFKGALSVNRYSGTDTIVIKIDDNNGSRIVAVELPAREMMMALTGLSAVECEYLLHSGIQNAGKVRETKEIIVKTERRAFTADEKRALLKPLETDGWRAYDGDLGNSHRMVDDGYKVNFTRFVDVEDNK